MPAPSVPDADLTQWQNAEWAPFAVDAQRKGRAAIGWSKNTLNVIFDVTDSSPMLNRGGNPNLLFKSGDCVEIDLSTADPDTQRANDQPILGDKRILVAMVQDGKGGEQPLAMLYEPVSNRKDRTPGKFSSPVSSHTFEHVGAIPARVVCQRHAGGYVLEVQLDADTTRLHHPGGGPAHPRRLRRPLLRPGRQHGARENTVG